MAPLGVSVGAAGGPAAAFGAGGAAGVGAEATWGWREVDSPRLRPLDDPCPGSRTTAMSSKREAAASRLVLRYTMDQIQF